VHRLDKAGVDGSNPSRPTKTDVALPNAGAVAQLGERLLCKQEVVGSIPSSSTSQVRLSVAREEQVSALLARAVISAESCSLFNNSEGKGSFGSDEDPNEQRVEMYLAHPRETNGAWMGGANTPLRVCVLATGFTTYGVKRRSACGGCLGDYRR
jgi:hypothetical protein